MGSKARSAAKVKLNSFDDLFGDVQKGTGEQITYAKLADLHTFKGHPLPHFGVWQKIQSGITAPKRYYPQKPPLARVQFWKHSKRSRSTGGDEMNMIELKDQIDILKTDMDGLTALVHTFLEGIRSESVSIDEIINATAALYMLVEVIAERMESIKNDLDSISSSSE